MLLFYAIIIVSDISTDGTLRSHNYSAYIVMMARVIRLGCAMIFWVHGGENKHM